MSDVVRPSPEAPAQASAGFGAGGVPAEDLRRQNRTKHHTSPPTTTAKITSQNENITLKLSGSRASQGVDLVALDGFIRHFLAALRDFDRYERGEPARKPGTPEASASAAAALRLVSLRPGSTIVELEPIRADEGGEQLALDDPPRARQVIDRLLDRVESKAALPAEVGSSLDGARRACGDDGAFEVSTEPPGRARRTVTFDQAAIGELRGPEPPPAISSSVAGRLTRLEESPDKALIRAPDGTEWIVSYPIELASDLVPLWRQNVYAIGEGERTSPRRGTFRLAHIGPLLNDTQTEMFTAEHISTDALLERQGISAPQGLRRVAAQSALQHDAEDDYLTAVLSDDL